MADLVSKTTPTKGVLKSRHTPVNEDNYWINPTLPDSHKKYWVNNSGTLEEGNQTAKDAIDLVETTIKDKGQVVKDIDVKKTILANWVVNNSITAFPVSNKKTNNGLLEKVFNNLGIGALSVASNILSTMSASGTLTQDLIDDLKAEIDNQI